jgi:hypothetical protein
MKKPISILSLLYILSCNNDIQNGKSNSSKIDTLTFTSKGFNSGHNIKLTNDNTFIDEQLWAGCLGGGGSQKIYGKYESKNGAYTFSPEKVERIEHFEFTENDVFTERTEFQYHKDSVLIEMPNQYYLVEWKQNKYLLSDFNQFSDNHNDNDFIRFAKYFNSELRGFKLDGHFLTNESKGNDSISSEFNYNQIPKKWRKYFLKEPLTATISDFKVLESDLNDNDGKYWVVEINKGTDNRIYEGLYFYDKDRFIEITVDSLFSNKSYGTVYLFNDENIENIIGTELKTKW